MRYARAQHFVLDVNNIILYLEVHHPRRSVVARLPQCGIVKRRAEAGQENGGGSLSLQMVNMQWQYAHK